MNPGLELPDRVIRDLPDLARLGRYGTRSLLQSALHYHREKHNAAEAQVIAALIEAYGCAA